MSCDKNRHKYLTNLAPAVATWFNLDKSDALALLETSFQRASLPPDLTPQALATAHKTARADCQALFEQAGQAGTLLGHNGLPRNPQKVLGYATLRRIERALASPPLPMPEVVMALARDKYNRWHCLTCGRFYNPEQGCSCPTASNPNPNPSQLTPLAPPATSSSSASASPPPAPNQHLELAARYQLAPALVAELEIEVVKLLGRFDQDKLTLAQLTELAQTEYLEQAVQSLVKNQLRPESEREPTLRPALRTVGYLYHQWQATKYNQQAASGVRPAHWQPFQTWEETGLSYEANLPGNRVLSGVLINPTNRLFNLEYLPQRYSKDPVNLEDYYFALNSCGGLDTANPSPVRSELLLDGPVLRYLVEQPGEATVIEQTESAERGAAKISYRLLADDPLKPTSWYLYGRREDYSANCIFEFSEEERQYLAQELARFPTKLAPLTRTAAAVKLPDGKTRVRRPTACDQPGNCGYCGARRGQGDCEYCGDYQERQAEKAERANSLREVEAAAAATGKTAGADHETLPEADEDKRRVDWRGNYLAPFERAESTVVTGLLVSRERIYTMQAVSASQLADLLTPEYLARRRPSSLLFSQEADILDTSLNIYGYHDRLPQGHHSLTPRQIMDLDRQLFAPTPAPTAAPAAARVKVEVENPTSQLPPQPRPEPGTQTNFYPNPQYKQVVNWDNAGITFSDLERLSPEPEPALEQATGKAGAEGGSPPPRATSWQVSRGASLFIDWTAWRELVNGANEFIVWQGKTTTNLKDKAKPAIRGHTRQGHLGAAASNPAPIGSVSPQTAPEATEDEDEDEDEDNMPF